MIVASSALESAINGMSSGALEEWALRRLRGEDRTPLLYFGKEPEEPEEAVAAAFFLDQSTLTAEKRAALIAALQNIFLEIQTPLVEKNAGDAVIFTTLRWAKVVERAKPTEVSTYASLLLHICEKAEDITEEILPQVAAASAAFPCLDEDDSSMWKRLLKKPSTAALAFRRLLQHSEFSESAENWVHLLKKHSEGTTTANVRLLLPALLRKVNNPETEAIPLLVELVTRAELQNHAISELEDSKNQTVRSLLSKLREAQTPLLGHVLQSKIGQNPLVTLDQLECHPPQRCNQRLFIPAEFAAKAIDLHSGSVIPSTLAYSLGLAIARRMAHSFGQIQHLVPGKCSSRGGGLDVALGPEIAAPNAYRGQRPKTVQNTYFYSSRIPTVYQAEDLDDALERSEPMTIANER